MASTLCDTVLRGLICGDAQVHVCVDVLLYTSTLGVLLCVCTQVTGLSKEVLLTKLIRCANDRRCRAATRRHLHSLQKM